MVQVCFSRGLLFLPLLRVSKCFECLTSPSYECVVNKPQLTEMEQYKKTGKSKRNKTISAFYLSSSMKPLPWAFCIFSGDIRNPFCFFHGRPLWHVTAVKADVWIMKWKVEFHVAASVSQCWCSALSLVSRDTRLFNKTTVNVTVATWASTSQIVCCRLLSQISIIKIFSCTYSLFTEMVVFELKW